MDTELLRHGAELMLVGMGTVFVFLSLLVVCTAAMSWLVLYWQGTSASPAAASADDSEITAAIAAALSHHRKRGR